jgi:hypothetical protein
VKYVTRNGVDLYGADVESFMNWDGTEMPVEGKMAYIRQRVPAAANTTTLRMRPIAGKQVFQEQADCSQSA